MAMTAHDGYCVQQAAILRRRLDVQQVDKSEQQAAVSGVDWPEQREIVAAVPRGDGFALLGQSLDSAPLSQEFSHRAPEGIVGLLGLCRLQHLAKNSDQCFLDSALLIMQRLQLFLGRGLSTPDAPQQHLDQFVATAHACLTQKGEQQRVPLPGWAMSRSSLTSNAAASAANWRSLVWAIPSRSGSGSISPASQSSRSIQSLIVVGVAGPGVCFRRLKLVVVVFAGLTSRASSIARCFAVTRTSTRL